MKAKIITAVIGLTVTTIVPVYADGIQSPRGISQSAWNASATYQNFQCPSGTSRNEGADMNYTTDKSDDYYFVTCDPIVIYVPSIPFTTPIVSETSTVTTVVTTPITNTETTTAVTSSTVNTSSTTSNVTTSTLTNSELIALILDLFNKLIALLSQLK